LMSEIRNSETGRFPSSYFPSVEYFIHLHRFRSISVDTTGTYQKQTVRNRCFILSPNGIQCLSVPVIHQSCVKQLMHEVKISYAEPWQKIHWRAIQSAYGRSPFFEFFRDELEDIYLQQFVYLAELNHHLLLFLLKKIKSDVNLIETGTSTYDDVLFLADAKNTDPAAATLFRQYNQVFGYKSGFVPNLSMLDLLLNCGNRAMDRLL
jgi:hypothetical protein